MSGLKTNDSKELRTLYVFRDFFKSFGYIVHDITLYKERYGIDLVEATQNGLSDHDALQNFVNTLSVQGLRTLNQAAAEVTSISHDLTNFTRYDTDQLKELEKKLSSLVKKLDIVISD